MSKRLKDWLDSLPSYPEMDIPYDEWLMSLKEGDKVVAFTCDVFGYSSNNTPRISVDKIESLNSNSVKFAHNKNRISRKTGACNKNEYDTMVWIAPNEEIGIALGKYWQSVKIILRSIPVKRTAKPDEIHALLKALDNICDTH